MMFTRFIEAVAEAVHSNPDAQAPPTVESLPDVRLRKKLVDELGDLEDAIQLAAEVVGIEGNRISTSPPFFFAKF